MYLDKDASELKGCKINHEIPSDDTTFVACGLRGCSTRYDQRGALFPQMANYLFIWSTTMLF